MKRAFFVIMLSGLLLLSSCCGCRKGPRVVVEGSSWTLNEIGGTVVDNPDREHYTLTLGGDLRYSGVGDCNRFSGTFQLKEGGAIRFSPVVATRMGCPDGVREAAYFDLFDRTTHYEIDREFLILMDADRHILASFRVVSMPEGPGR